MSSEIDVVINNGDDDEMNAYGPRSLLILLKTRCE